LGRTEPDPKTRRKRGGIDDAVPEDDEDGRSAGAMTDDEVEVGPEEDGEKEE
jgi:hypothetical protein